MPVSEPRIEYVMQILQAWEQYNDRVPHSESILQFLDFRKSQGYETIVCESPATLIHESKTGDTSKSSAIPSKEKYIYNDNGNEHDHESYCGRENDGDYEDDTGHVENHDCDDAGCSMIDPEIGEKVLGEASNNSRDQADKCVHCQRWNFYCDGAKPKCRSCELRGYVCYSQGETRPLANSQDPKDKCRHCQKYKKWCDGAKPQCGACKKGHLRCYLEGETPITHGQNPEEKCGPCFKNKCRCDGATPTCGSCKKKKLICRSQGEASNGPQDLREKCWNCFYEGYRCDGAKPKCGPCVKFQRRCQDQSEEYEVGVYGQDPAKKCCRCLSQRLICEGVFPCKQCLASKRPCRRQDEALILPQKPEDKCRKCLKEGRRCVRLGPTASGDCETCKKRRKICYSQGNNNEDTNISTEVLSSAEKTGKNKGKAKAAQKPSKQSTGTKRAAVGNISENGAGLSAKRSRRATKKIDYAEHFSDVDN